MLWYITSVAVTHSSQVKHDGGKLRRDALGSEEHAAVSHAVGNGNLMWSRRCNSGAKTAAAPNRPRLGHRSHGGLVRAGTSSPSNAWMRLE